MFTQIENASSGEMVLWICALAGSTFFLFKVVTSLFAGFDHADTGHDHMMTHDANDSADAFKILSLYTISAFIMMFGWAGLAALKEFHLPFIGSLVVGGALGTLTMFMTAAFFRSTKLLTSPGARYSIHQTIGSTAKVYERIPASARGIIQVTVNGVLREVEAIAEDNSQIESMTDVIVTRVLDDKTVVVRATKI